jgi:hypothetical protein
MSGLMNASLVARLGSLLWCMCGVLVHGQNCYDDDSMSCADIMATINEPCSEGGCTQGPLSYWWCELGRTQYRILDNSVQVLIASSDGTDSYTVGPTDIVCEESRACATFCVPPANGGTSSCEDGDYREWVTGAVYRDTFASGAECDVIIVPIDEPNPGAGP